MEKESIIKSIANIEDNLQKMETARKQVEKVTTSGNLLTVETGKLAKEVSKFAVEIKVELLDTISSFSEYLSQSGEGLTSKLEATDKLIEGKLKLIDKHILKKIEEGDREVRVKLDKFKEDVNKLRDNSKIAIASVTKISEDSLKTQNESTLETVKSINVYIHKIQEFISEITELDLVNKLFRIDKNISSVESTLLLRINKIEENTTEKINNQFRWLNESRAKEIKKQKSINTLLLVALVVNMAFLMYLSFK